MTYQQVQGKFARRSDAHGKNLEMNKRNEQEI
jgi:hypothetical protein